MDIVMSVVTPTDSPSQLQLPVCIVLHDVTATFMCCLINIAF